MGGIVCTCTELRKIDNRWVKSDEWTSNVTSQSIANMICGGEYLTRMGGSSDVSYARNRRFGLVPIKVVVTSICGTIRKVYNFNYNYVKV